ncbi:hypothetical protein DFH27DRAFT_93881 [Peziza echinospora]|nr:hypothetical protein DFH27DRAFT_93881 [Peziza echinospora]
MRLWVRIPRAPNYFLRDIYKNPRIQDTLLQRPTQQLSTLSPKIQESKPHKNHIMVERISFIVTGRVQGVGFRETTENFARQYGVRGFVYNTPDGRVAGEAQAYGDQLELFKLFAFKRGAGRVVSTYLLLDCFILLSTLLGVFFFSWKRNE